MREACHFCKLAVAKAGLRAARAGPRALANEEKSAPRQVKTLNKCYADNFLRKKRRDQRRVLYRLMIRVLEATRRKPLEADRDVRSETGWRLCWHDR